MLRSDSLTLSLCRLKVRVWKQQKRAEELDCIMFTAGRTLQTAVEVAQSSCPTLEEVQYK